MKFIKHIICLLLLAIDRLTLSNKPKKHGIALVRLDAIGDFVVWSHSAAEYRKLYQGEKIILIANSLWADLASRLPYWDEVWPVDPQAFKKNIFYRWKILRRVSKYGFQVAIQPTHSRILLQGDTLIRATNATYRLGSIGDLSNSTVERKTIADRWYTALFPVKKKMQTELERNAEFVSHIKGEEFLSRICVFPRFEVEDYFERFQLQKNYFIIFPGASTNNRKWPPEKFAKVLTHLHQQFGWQALVCGSPSERSLCQYICDKAGVDALNLAGKTTLVELVEITRKAKLLIGNETSAIHIAVAVSTPSICITGGGHYERFVPYPKTVKGVLPKLAFKKMPCYYCNWECIQQYNAEGPVPCIEGVSQDTVLYLINNLVTNMVN